MRSSAASPGAAIAADGLDVVYWSGIWEKVVKPGVLSPLMGFAIAFALMIAIIWVDPPALAEQGEPRLPARADLLGQLRRVHARHERRAEDDGHHLARAHHHRAPQRRGLRRSVLGHRLVRDWRWRSARTRAAGGSSGRWERGSRRSIRRRDSPRRPRAPESSGRPRTRLPGLDDADDLGLRHRRGREPRASSPSAGGSQGTSSFAWILTLPAAGLVGALMEVVTRMPGGDLIVFLLAGAIAAAAFLGRRYETRRLLPAPA